MFLASKNFLRFSYVKPIAIGVVDELGDWNTKAVTKAIKSCHSSEAKTNDSLLLKSNFSSCPSSQSHCLIPIRNIKSAVRVVRPNNALFVSAPPPTPAKMVLMGPPTPEYLCDPTRCQRVKQAIKNINDNISYGVGDDKLVRNTTSEFVSDCSAMFGRGVCMASKEEISINPYPIVKHLLHDLLLKIISSGQLENSRKANMKSDAKLMVETATGSTTNNLNAHSMSSIAIQVQDTLTNSDTDTETTIDDWIYDARTLRDSHVRLVLRQLRHVERLNHALDKAARIRMISDTQKIH